MCLQAHMDVLRIQLENRLCCSNSWLHFTVNILLLKREEAQWEMTSTVPDGMDQSWMPKCTSESLPLSIEWAFFSAGNKAMLLPSTHTTVLILPFFSACCFHLKWCLTKNRLNLTYSEFAVCLVKCISTDEL